MTAVRGKAVEAKKELKKEEEIIIVSAKRCRFCGHIMTKGKILKNLELEKNLKQLEKTTKKPKSFHVQKALTRYLEDMEDIRDIEEYIKKKKEGMAKYYTSEELEKRLNLK